VSTKALSEKQEVIALQKSAVLFNSTLEAMQDLHTIRFDDRAWSSQRLIQAEEIRLTPCLLMFQPSYRVYPPERQILVCTAASACPPAPAIAS
jgi:hypothetical protein